VYRYHLRGGAGGAVVGAGGTASAATSEHVQRAAVSVAADNHRSGGGHEHNWDRSDDRRWGRDHDYRSDRDHDHPTGPAQPPKSYRRGRRTLIRTDLAGGTNDFVAWLAKRGRWPKGMLLIVRKERPHPGAQLRITDADGMRITCFATNTPGQPFAELELRHRLRARAEDRVRAACATGLRNLPLHDTAQNRVWLEIVQIALDLLAWMPMLALNGQARLWEPRRLRLRLFSSSPPAAARSSASLTTGHGPMSPPAPSDGSTNCPTQSDQ